MSRANRLFDLIQILRRHRYAVSGETLARELGISVRTLYRDIATLQQQGATIDGAPGLGYVLRPGFLLPPLMFTREEIEALALGSRWVADRADANLAHAAQDALAKIAAVLPVELRHELDASALLVGPGAPIAAGGVDVGALRRAIRGEHKVAIDYVDLSDARTERTIWPIALGIFDRVSVVVAWCELRDAFRHFRTDRIAAMTPHGARYPRRRHALMREWRHLQTPARVPSTDRY